MIILNCRQSFVVLGLAEEIEKQFVSIITHRDVGGGGPCETHACRTRVFTDGANGSAGGGHRSVHDRGYHCASQAYPPRSPVVGHPSKAGFSKIVMRA